MVEVVPADTRSPERIQKETREALAALNEGVAFQELNYGSNIPLTERQAEVQNRPANRLTLRQMRDYIRQNNWSPVIRQLIATVLGNNNDVEGLGIQRITRDNQIPLHQTVGVLAQIDQRDPARPHNFQEDFRLGYLRYEFAKTMTQRGYTESTEANDGRAATSIEVTAARGTSLQGYVTPAVWNQMQGDNPELVTSLRPNVVLPVGSFVHLSSTGVPLCVTPRNVPANTLPAFPVFRKRTGPDAANRPNDREAGVEYLRRNLRPGDLLITSRSRANRTIMAAAFTGINRRFFGDGNAGAGFHGTHVIVCNAPGQLLHNTEGVGKEQKSIEQMFRDNDFDAVTVVRPRGSDARRQEFVEQVNKFAANIQGYSKTRAVGLAAGRIAGSVGGRGAQVGQTIGNVTGALQNDRECICTDMVRVPASRMSPPYANLGTAEGPASIAASSDVSVQYAIDLGPVAPPPPPPPPTPRR